MACGTSSSGAAAVQHGNGAGMRVVRQVQLHARGRARGCAQVRAGMCARACERCCTLAGAKRGAALVRFSCCTAAAPLLHIARDSAHGTALACRQVSTRWTISCSIRVLRASAVRGNSGSHRWTCSVTSRTAVYAAIAVFTTRIGHRQEGPKAGPLRQVSRCAAVMHANTGARGILTPARHRWPRSARARATRQSPRG